VNPTGAAHHQGPAPVVVGSAAAPLRSSLGPLPWCALECLVARATVNDSSPLADASVRSLAVELGVAKNTAHRALAVLLAAGLATAEHERRSDGTFGPGRYRLHVEPDVLSVSAGSGGRTPRATAKPGRAGRPNGDDTPTRPSRRRRQVSDQADQLSLLPPA
jgi:DNA-binding transcriptional ArsR family regulator